jgi:hypothetical protein
MAAAGVSTRPGLSYYRDGDSAAAVPPAAQADLQRQLDDVKRRGDQDRREVGKQADLAKQRAAELTAEVRAHHARFCIMHATTHRGAGANPSHTASYLREVAGQ